MFLNLKWILAWAGRHSYSWICIIMLYPHCWLFHFNFWHIMFFLAHFLLKLVQLASSGLLIFTRASNRFAKVVLIAATRVNICILLIPVSKVINSLGENTQKFHFNRRCRGSHIRFYFWLLILFHSLLPPATLRCRCCLAKLFLQLQCVALFFQKLVSLHSIFHETEQRAVFRERFAVNTTPTFVPLRLTIRNYHWAQLRWKDVVLTSVSFPFRSQPNAYCLALWNFSLHISLGKS